MWFIDPEEWGARMKEYYEGKAKLAADYGI